MSKILQRTVDQYDAQINRLATQIAALQTQLDDYKQARALAGQVLPPAPPNTDNVANGKGPSKAGAAPSKTTPAPSGS